MPVRDRKPPDGKPKRRHVATGRPRGGRYIGNGVDTHVHVYTPELADRICERIRNGETLKGICRDPNIGVTENAVREWVEKDRDGFAARYARARVCQAEAWSDQIVEISEERDTDPNDRRVRIDAKKWLMSKLAPKRYGDKLTLAGDPDAPLRYVLELEEAIASLSPVELAALERFNNELIAAREGKIADDGENLLGNSGNSNCRNGK